ncbi:MAG: hypothetical protein ACKV2Q_08935 [Planctomycetaceae bacterium]
MFLEGFDQGFTLDGLLRESKKLPGVRLHKIMLLDDSIYELRPSFEPVQEQLRVLTAANSRGVFSGSVFLRAPALPSVRQLVFCDASPC